MTGKDAFPSKELVDRATAEDKGFARTNVAVRWHAYALAALRAGADEFKASRMADYMVEAEFIRLERWIEHEKAEGGST